MAKREEGAKTLVQKLVEWISLFFRKGWGEYYQEHTGVSYRDSVHILFRVNRERNGSLKRMRTRLSVRLV